MLLAVSAAACGSSEPEPAAAPPEPTTEASEPPATTEATTSEEAAPPPAETETKEEKPKPPPGAPAFVAGYRSWIKLNSEPIPPRDADPHNGTKDVFVSRRAGTNGLYRNGTVVVKEAARPGTDFIGLIATMRKKAGADPAHNDWIFIEYTRDSPDEPFAEIARGAVCWSCHIGAEATDYVFTQQG